MSGIGSAGFGPGVNPYAGNLNSTKGTDAARADSSDRSTAADRSQFSQSLNGTGETERVATLVMPARNQTISPTRQTMDRPTTRRPDRPLSNSRSMTTAAT
jgi:hypothetical protein